METLVKNVFTFANILKQAGSDAVLRWNLQSLDHAFSWAEYCQQVAGQIRDKPFEDDFLRHVRMITMHLNPPSCLQLDLDILDSAVSVLRKCLLRNPHLTEKQMKIVFDRSLSSTITTQGLIQDCGTISREGCIQRMCQKILDLFPNLKELTPQIRWKSQATVLLRNLLHLSEASKSERFETYLFGVLDQLSVMDEGTEVILELLLVTEEIDEMQNDLDKICNVVFAWLERASSKVILKPEKKLLTELSCRHTRFLKIYMKHLVKWADTFQPSYNVSTTGQLYTWRSPNCKLQDRSFDELCVHIVSLCKSNKHIKDTIIADILQFQKKSHVNVYKDILRKLKP